MDASNEHIRELEEKSGVNFWLVFIPYFLIAGFAFFLMIKIFLTSKFWVELKRGWEQKRRERRAAKLSQNSKEALKKDSNKGKFQLLIIRRQSFFCYS